jgi:nucleoside-triphosphatase
MNAPIKNILLTGLVMIDEVGKMECFSKKFVALVSGLLESEPLFIATVAIRGGGLIAEIKKRTDIQLIEVNRNNQDRITEQVLKLLDEEI